MLIFTNVQKQKYRSIEKELFCIFSKTSGERVNGGVCFSKAVDTLLKI